MLRATKRKKFPQNCHGSAMGATGALVNAEKKQKTKQNKTKIEQRKKSQPNLHGSTKIVSVGSSVTIVIVQKVLI